MVAFLSSLVKSSHLPYPKLSVGMQMLQKLTDSLQNMFYTPPDVLCVNLALPLELLSSSYPSSPLLQMAFG
jgi:hypothetical protein